MSGMLRSCSAGVRCSIVTSTRPYVARRIRCVEGACLATWARRWIGPSPRRSPRRSAAALQERRQCRELLVRHHAAHLGFLVLDGATEHSGKRGTGIVFFERHGHSFARLRTRNLGSKTRAGFCTQGVYRLAFDACGDACRFVCRLCRCHVCRALSFATPPEERPYGLPMARLTRAPLKIRLGCHLTHVPLQPLPCGPPVTATPITFPDASIAGQPLVPPMSWSVWRRRSRLRRTSSSPA